MNFFLIISFSLVFAGSFACLTALTIIDLKIRLLPNTYVFAFALFGFAFHGFHDFSLLTPLPMMIGACVGGGLLLSVRTIANMMYKQDTLGLGDVKLLMAGGLWLGPAGVLNAIIVGACGGIIHGLGIAFYNKIKHKQPLNLSRLSLPAGPGFIFGIVCIGIYQYGRLAFS